MKSLIKTKTEAPSLLTVLALSCFALCPTTEAVVPPPDGGYPGFTTAAGTNALKHLTTGVGNTGVGWYSLFTGSVASYNTGVGAGTLALNSADENTATGAAALLFNTSGESNTANGALALLHNTTGDNNTADGASALLSNTTGFYNTANGAAALANSTTGNDNTANGALALFSNTTGSFNTANGAGTLFSNTIGDNNTANGDGALSSNTTGSGNTAKGALALFSNTTGNDNIAIGRVALNNNTTGSKNIAIGQAAGDNQTVGSNNIYIGAFVEGFGGEVNQTYIGNINTTSVNGGNADFVSVNLKTGLLGHASSSRRYKEDIKPMDKASEALFALKPVTYRYKKEIDRSQSLDYGFVAEDVAQVDANLAVRNRVGQIESVRYNAVTAMLLNEFLKEHRRNQEQETTIACQQRQIEAITATVKEQAAQIQNVSDQLDLRKSGQQVVTNP